MPNTLKELLLGRGWAGRTISREQTVERINPLIEQHVRLNHSYRAVSRAHSNREVSTTIEDLLKTARADVGKLSETVFSAGGSAYNGTDLEPEDFDLGRDDAQMLETLQALEQDFHDAVTHERDEVEHQMRTRAILEVVQGNSEERLDTLKSLRSGHPSSR
jgi:hypothetical protein